MSTAKGLVAKLIIDLEAIHGVGPDGVTSRCETGDPYVTICWSKDGKNIKPESQGARLFDTEDRAWIWWCMAFIEYILYRQGKIHWRARPALSMVAELTDPPEYVVYARVFVEVEGK